MSPGNKPDILLVDDEAQIRRLLRSVLEGQGYSVREAQSGRVALGEIALDPPSLIILDLGLPDTPGTEVLRALRPICRAPVLVLSVRGQEQSKIDALDAGADDYLTKPFGTGELLARLRVLMRRTQTRSETQNIFQMGERRQVLRDGRPIELTPREYALLRLLILHSDRVLTHSQILRELWGNQGENQNHYLRVYMMRLRRKLGEEASDGYIQTQSGVGYCFVSNPIRPR